MRVAITDTAIGKAKRDAAKDGVRRELADAVERGLRLRVTPAGATSWVLGCRDKHGQPRRFPLGSWPAIGLRKAREDAQALRQRVRMEGADPIVEAKLTRAAGQDAKAGIGTFASVLDAYENRKDARRMKSWVQGRKAIESLFAPLLSRPAATMTLGELTLITEGHPFPKSAAYVVRTLRPILKWASEPRRGFVSPDLAKLTGPEGGEVTGRDRTLTRDELAALLPVLSADSGPYAGAMVFMLRTLARRQEAASARWGDINLSDREWTIPDTKNGRPHVVPLSRQVVDFLRSRLPTGPTGKAIEPDPAGLIFATSTGAIPGNWDRHTKAIHELSGTKGWTRHDLRRTGATLLGGMGIEPHVIEAALGHSVIHSKLAGIYNKSRYQPEVAAALQRLSDALDLIEAGGGKVIRPTWAAAG